MTWKSTVSIAVEAINTSYPSKYIKEMRFLWSLGNPLNYTLPQNFGKSLPYVALDFCFQHAIPHAKVSY